MMQRGVLLRKAQRPPSNPIVRACFATRAPQGPRDTYRRSPKPPRLPRKPESSPGLSEKGSSSTNAVSNALHDTNPQDNNLLSPVHVPEDPNGVLNEGHPAASILVNSAIVVQRQLELMNVMLGFEQANKYVIMDPQGNHTGYMAEREMGMGNMMARQWFRTHRSFTTHVFDKHEKEVLRFDRPFSWISSRIRVYDPLEPSSTALQAPSRTSLSISLSTSLSTPGPQVSPLALDDMRIIGEAHQQWAPLRRKYNLFLHRPVADDPATPQLTSGALSLSPTKELQLASQQQQQQQQQQPHPPGGGGGEFTQFAYVDEPFLSWDFSLLSSHAQLLGSVNRNFAGFGREIFTDTGVYALRMDAADPAHETKQVGSTTPGGKEAGMVAHKGMTLDQRAVMLATAVSVDFDYFSRKSGAGGVGMMPLWFPGSGGAAAEGGAAEGAAGTAAGGVAVGEAGAGVVGNAARGAGGMGEGAAVGAGSMAGYEAMQRGVYGDQAGQAAGAEGVDHTPPPPPPAPEGGQEGQEDVWGRDEDPWGGQGGAGGASGGGGGSDGGGGGGGGDGGGFDFGDWF